MQANDPIGYCDQALKKDIDNKIYLSIIKF